MAQYVTVDAPTVALTHVRVVDGTGAPALEDQTIVVVDGRIAGVGPSGRTDIPVGARVLEYRGHTVIPGLVGMHDHLFTTAPMVRDEAGRLPPPGFILTSLPFTATRLYLGAGVTTIRTAGTFFGDTEVSIKRLVDGNQMPGPKIHLTSPYFDGPSEIFHAHVLTGPEDVRRRVEFFAADGFTSWKAYTGISREDLRTLVQEAHARHTKVTAHLCSVTWSEAIDMGIDNLEHGPIYTDTGFVPNKLPDTCVSGAARLESWAPREIDGPDIQGLIRKLVDHHVAVTSTLPVFAAGLIDRPPSPRALQALATDSRISFLTARAQTTFASNERALAFLRKEMAFELAFAKAGGVLLAGPDPTGNGGVLPGYGDWWELELLVEGGFSPLEAIHIATLSGAEFLGESARLGSVAIGKQADLVVVKGEPDRRISDIEGVVLVFKDGVGYDSSRLLSSARGLVGIK